MRLAPLWTLMMLAASLAGCFDPQRPLEGAASPPLPADLLLQADPALPTLRLELCVGVVPAFHVLRPWAREFLPPEFVPAGSYPGLAQFELHALRCPRAVIGDEVISDAALLWTYAWTEPKNESWSGRGASHYTYDVLANHPRIVDALAAQGLRATLTAFEETQTPAAQGLVLSHWRFEAPQATVSLVFHHREHAWQNQTGKGTLLHKWQGEGPFSRLDVQELRQGHLWWKDTGRVEMKGTSPFIAAAGTVVVPVQGMNAHTLYWDLEPHARTYETPAEVPPPPAAALHGLAPSSEELAEVLKRGGGSLLPAVGQDGHLPSPSTETPGLPKAPAGPPSLPKAMLPASPGKGLAYQIGEPRHVVFPHPGEQVPAKFAKDGHVALD